MGSVSGNRRRRDERGTKRCAGLRLARVVGRQGCEDNDREAEHREAERVCRLQVSGKKTQYRVHVTVKTAEFERKHKEAEAKEAADSFAAKLRFSSAVQTDTRRQLAVKNLVKNQTSTAYFDFVYTDPASGLPCLQRMNAFDIVLS